MLVAPLMGPIFGIALALLIGDRRMLQAALTAEIAGVAGAILIGLGIGLLPLRPEFGSEILARTQPNLFDLIIALASGLAGAYAVVDERVSPALPGVAIATALVPPLATGGLCLAAGNWDWAKGALLLFAVNLLAIELAAALVFAAYGLIRLQADERSSLGLFFRRFGLSLAILLLAGVFLTQTMAGVLADRTLLGQIRVVLAEQLTAIPGVRLSDLRLERGPGTIMTVATVLTPQGFEPRQVAGLEAELQARVSPDSRLIVRSLISRDADRYGPVFVSSDKLQQEAENERLSRVSAHLNEYFQEQGGQLDDLFLQKSGEEWTLTAVVRTSREFAPAQVAEAEQRLRELETGPLALIVRSVLTRDADRQQFLDQDGVPSEPLAGEELAVYVQAEWLIRQLIERDFPGVALTDLQIAPEMEGWLLWAEFRTPLTIDPEQVRMIEDRLRQEINPGIRLLVNSVVGGTASGTGYIDQVRAEGLSRLRR